MSLPNSPSLQDALVANLDELQAFARSRLRDEHLAADAVQESLLRALRAEEKLAHSENLRAWLFRILRHVLIDLHRRRVVRAEAMERLAEESDISAPEADATICACLRALLPTLRQEYAEALSLVDLEERPSSEVAERLGISVSNLKVRRHRARQELRQRLEETCRTCARHGCLDCTCDVSPSEI